MNYECEDWRHVHDRNNREKCGRRARWYVISGPMFVCANHRRHQESQGESCNPLGGAA